MTNIIRFPVERTRGASPVSGGLEGFDDLIKLGNNELISRQLPFAILY